MGEIVGVSDEFDTNYSDKIIKAINQ